MSSTKYQQEDSRRYDNMMIKSAEEIIIYESADGGKTVYSRKMGETNRTLHSVDPEHKKQQELAQHWVKYQDIIRKSETDSGLKDMLDKVEMYYDLKYG